MTNPDFEDKQVGAKKAAEMIFGLKLTKNKRNYQMESLNSLESSLRSLKVEKLEKHKEAYKRKRRNKNKKGGAAHNPSPNIDS